MPFAPPPPAVRRSPCSTALRRITGVALLTLLALCGCSRFRPHSQQEYVYVIARQSILRDRIAAVSNRTGEVTNGQRLEVLERDRRFVKVKAPNGAVGWLEARLTADQALADQFEALNKEHLHDPVVASAAVQDDVYMHIAPGRDTDRFFRLAEGDPLSLLERAAVVKPISAGSALADAAKLKPGEPPPPPPMEDWWLVRGPHGETGWVYSGLIDVNVPEAIASYGEGQRIVGAYVLATVNDPDYAAKQSQTSAAIPEYLTVVTPPKAGLPYDFDQVRVFIWNLKKHRYETSFRERNIEGFLPVKLFKAKDPYGKAPDAAELLPTFSYRVLAAGAPPPVPDPQTSKTPGLLHPAALVTKTYRLEGNICVRLLPPNTPAPDEAHPAPEPKNEKKGKRRR